MPPTNSPTLRQRRLGAELRKLRERAGLTATGAATLLGVNQARVSMMETGRTPISADRVRSMARAYDCFDAAYVDALAAMTGRRTRGWWEEYREHLPANLVDLVELEHHAASLRVALFVHVPALLQTTEHARALFRTVVPPLRQYEIEHRLTHRIKRQGILYRSNPTPYLVTIHEAALRMGFGGRAVAVEQLRHLVDMSELPMSPSGSSPSAMPASRARGKASPMPPDPFSRLTLCSWTATTVASFWTVRPSSPSTDQ